MEQALKTRLSTWQHESVWSVVFFFRRKARKILKLFENQKFVVWNQQGHSKVCTLEYSLPDYVNEHVELLIGLTEFWTPPSGPKIVALDEPVQFIIIIIRSYGIGSFIN